MYELVQAGDRTYYIDCPAKMGLYVDEEGGAYLIDSGNDKDAGRKVDKLLKEHGWALRAIFNTHSNADHTGGNKLLQDRWGCPVYAKGMEAAVTKYPVLEPSFLYGGYPPKALRNKFLMAQPSQAQEFPQEAEALAKVLPEGMEMIDLPGHFFEMTGFKTPDGVWFLADCLSGANILEKYHISFIYDVRKYLETLDFIGTLTGKLFVPAHAEATEDIRPLAEVNRQKVLEICGAILALCETPRSFEDILAALFARYDLAMDFNQNVLVGSTVKSYLAYLAEEEKLEFSFTDNKLVWTVR